MARRKDYLTKSAESVGAALGHVTARVEAWKKERTELAAHLKDVLASTQAILRELGHEAETTGAGILAEIKRKGGRPKGYEMSEETKAKLRAAWARRKDGVTQEVAKDLKGVKKAVRKMSAEARAKISAAQKRRWAKKNS